MTTLTPADDSGHVLGAHCVIDVTPRTFTDADITVLTAGAGEAMRLLTGHRTIGTTAT